MLSTECAPSPPTSALAVATLAAMTSGCGFLWTHGPPDSHLEMTEFDCTTGNGGPTVDLVVGALSALAGTGVQIASGSEWDFTRFTIPMIGGGLLLGVSGLNGFDKTRECREALRLLRERTRRP